MTVLLRLQCKAREFCCLSDVGCLLESLAAICVPLQPLLLLHRCMWRKVAPKSGPSTALFGNPKTGLSKSSLSLPQIYVYRVLLMLA